MKCVICKNEKFERILVDEKWEIVRCLRCGLVITKRDGDFDYKNYHRDSDYEKFRKHFRNIFQKRVDIISSFKKSGRVLDIGASTGGMLTLFKEKGWKTWGVEPSESAFVAGSKGHKMINTTFEKAGLPKSYFDVVILNHTLEHVDDPILVMKKVRTVLKENGIVLVDVPNFGGLSARLLGKRWPFLVPLEHNFQFTKETLVKLFEKAGLEVLHTESRSGIFEFANPVAECLDALLSLKKRFFKNLLFVPYDIVATALDMGDSISIIGKKK